MEQLDSTIITTAIPDIARSLNSTPLRLSLAITAYVLTSTSPSAASGSCSPCASSRTSATMTSRGSISAAS